MPVNYFRGFTKPERSDAANLRLDDRQLSSPVRPTPTDFSLWGSTHPTCPALCRRSPTTARSAKSIRLLQDCVPCLFGAATSAILINWGRRRQLHSLYAMPLMLEDTLLLCFGLLGSNLETRRVLFVPTTVCPRCYVMDCCACAASAARSSTAPG